LIAETESAKQVAQSEGPKYVGWLGRVQLLVDRLGPEGETFANELRRLRDQNTWDGRLAAANAMRGGAVRVIRQNAANRWIAEAVGGDGGLLEAIVRAVDDRMLARVEDRVAPIVYTGVLDEAAELLRPGHHGCAAAITRAALEDGLRRLARRYGMAASDEQSRRASAINTWLRAEAGAYTMATERQVQSWLDPANAYLHSPTEWVKYSIEDIGKNLGNVRGFLGQHSL